MIDQRVLISTAFGAMHVHVDAVHAPETARYFLRDVAAGLFDGTSFYRIAIDANQDGDQPASIEVIQGGMPQPAVPPAPSLRHESTAETGLRHERGTISLARFAPGSVYHSFFICRRDEPSLDHGGARNPDRLGFPAFGRLVEGFDVLDRLFEAAEAQEQLSRTIAIYRMGLV